MPSISAISSTATLVGVPPTAAEGCSAAARSSTLAPSVSCTTPATSVARCITLGRCSTNGTSGTFVEEQYGASDSATERTAYSCSSRSFDERASWPASAGVALVVARAPDRAGQHPRGDQAALATDQQLGGGAEEAVDVEGPAHRRSRRRAAQRPAHVDRRRRRWRPGRGRAPPSRARRPRCAARRRPPRTPRRRRSSRRRRRPRCAARRARLRRRASGIAASSSCADHGDPGASAAACRRPPAGTTSTLSPGSSAKREAAQADQAAAGHLDLVADHAAADDLAPPVGRVGEPVGALGAALAATPQATMPSPRRSQAIGSSAGSRSIRDAAARRAPPRPCVRPDVRGARPRVGWSRDERTRWPLATPRIRCGQLQ